MRVCNSPDISQENISELFYGLDMVCAYIDENIFKDHIKALDRVLYIIVEEGLKVNTGKYLFGKTETEYILVSGYVITW